MDSKTIMALAVLASLGCGSSSSVSSSTQTPSGSSGTGESAPAVTRAPVDTEWDEPRLERNEVEFQVADQRLLFVARGQFVVIPSVDRAGSVEAVEWAAGGESVSIDYVDPFACEPNHQLVLSRDELDAAWIHQKALEAHRGANYELAVSALRRALELDPDHEMATIHLARSLNQLDRPRDAIAVLRELLAAKPLYVYSQLATDGESRSLLEEPELSALRAEEPTTIEPQSLTTEFLVGPTGAMVIPLREQSSATEQVRIESLIRSPEGEELYRTLLVDWIDTDESGAPRASRRPLLTGRLEALASWLGDLGFHVIPDAIHIELHNLPSTRSIPTSPYRIRLDDAGFTVTESAQVIRFLQEPSEAMTGTVSYFPEPRSIVLRWSNDRPEGCDNGTETYAAIVPLEDE